jgi:1-acyl-sn-glycerol-3-phosphate acyltransferase
VPGGPCVLPVRCTLRNALSLSDLFYNLVFCAGCPAFAVSASPTILHRERARREGAFLLAANHLSPYDVPCLIKETPRVLDFVSIVEVFRNPVVALFYSSMGAFPLDRGRADVAGTRVIFDRLRRGRAVAIFPEGRIRPESESVLHGARFKDGVVRLAQLAGVPIVPCAIVGTAAYHRVSAWLPLRRTRYGINYGNPIMPSEDLSKMQAALRQAYLDLYEELRSAMQPRGDAGRTRDKSNTP